MNRLSILFLVVLGCARAEEPVVEETPKVAAIRCVNEWTRVANGIDYRMLNCTASRFDLHLVRIDPRVAMIDALARPGSTAADLGREYTFAINANFLTTSSVPSAWWSRAARRSI